VLQPGEPDLDYLVLSDKIAISKLLPNYPPSSRLLFDPVSDHLDFVLAQWARERPDLDVSAMGVIGRISRLARVIDLELARTFSEHGLDRPSFDVLATLRRSGPPHRLTPAELSRSSMVTSGAITQRLDRLEKRGLVRRTPSDLDGRIVYVSLTPEGFELIDHALPDHVANEQRILAAITPAQRKALADTLRKLLESRGDTDN
jgi:DNA-binding MarR family transcriptional regulator